METMGTDQLLDLFNLSSTNAGGPSKPPPTAVADTLPDLWEDSQYEEEYDMTQFIKGLNKMKS